MSFRFEEYERIIDSADTVRVNGRVNQVVGLLIEASGPQAAVGDLVHVLTGLGPMPCEVVGFRRGAV
ncbi:MAG TPA: hypothetical protein PLY73_12850, partial [Candidatus Ozemobacteraceae bacterium]|nr:hypothetical protein [Candidatus Ozemobacteraceae bacterium]